MVRTYRVIGCFKMPKRGIKVVPTPGESVYNIPIDMRPSSYTLDNNLSSTSTLDIAHVSVSLFTNILLPERRYSYIL